MAADDERRAEIEAVREALCALMHAQYPGQDYAPLEFSDEAEAAVAALDRVRDARGDDEPVVMPERVIHNEIAERERLLDAARRSPQGEDHEAVDVHRCDVEWCGARWIGSKVRCPRGHDDGITTERFFRSSSRVGSVAVEDVLRYFEIRGMTLTAGEIRAALVDLASPASTGDQEENDRGRH